jgi:dephospho-CoA kinase
VGRQWDNSPTVKRSNPKKPVIGLVGGVAAGKSTVAAEMARLGAKIIDGDRIGHQVLRDPAAKSAVRRRWGVGVFTCGGAVDRAALGQVVFGEPEELAALNRILHPRIRREIKRQIAAARKSPRVVAVVLDAAILFEAGWDDLCTAVVFVRAPALGRARRAAAQRGWDRSRWRKREISQISLDKKRRKSDYVIDNSSGVSRLRDQVRRLFLAIVQAADRPRR